MVYSVPTPLQALQGEPANNSSRFHAREISCSRFLRLSSSHSEIQTRKVQDFGLKFPAKAPQCLNSFVQVFLKMQRFSYVAKRCNLQLCSSETSSHEERHNFLISSSFLYYNEFKLNQFLDHKTPRICKSLSQNMQLPKFLHFFL